MIVWLITVGEPINIIDKQPHMRMHRTGILAQKLSERGHKVTWWTSTFDHAKKKQYTDKTEQINNINGYKIVLMHGIPYSRNISIRRIVNHYQIARAFERIAQQEPKPDIIYCSYPTIELSASAVKYGNEHHLPVIIDVRDLWPDIFIDAFPEMLFRIGKIFLKPLMNISRKVFSECYAVTAVSEGYLEWGLRRGDRQRSANDAVFVLGYERPSLEAIWDENTRYKLEKMGVNELKTICWFIGTFGRTYDLNPVIEAARLLENSGRSDVLFVFSGDGENNQCWRQLADGLSNIVFTGWIDSQQLAYLLDVADIGLMAYVKGAPQGFPNKLFEYLSEGIPILSSLNGETAAFLAEHDCGMTYDAGNSISFLNTLECMLASDYKCRGNNGKLIFDRQYSADIVYRQLAEYLELIGGQDVK
jgi:glycosyltransferase involved in cell wall biosynthesis